MGAAAAAILVQEASAGTALAPSGLRDNTGLAHMTTDQSPVSPRAERIRHSASEIAYVLELLKANNQPITTHLHGGELGFTSRLRVIDPAGSRIIIEPSPDEAANAALLSRPRCSFFASVPGGRVEFAAADPQRIEHDGTPAIRLKFPDVLADRQRREYDRATISPQVPLECVADEGGVLSFKGGLVDISIGGLGFLMYDPNITLEPGTVLKGCVIEPYDAKPLVLDLEVRVDPRGQLRIAVPQQCLGLLERYAATSESRRERVPQRVDVELATLGIDSIDARSREGAGEDPHRSTARPRPHRASGAQEDVVVQTHGTAQDERLDLT